MYFTTIISTCRDVVCFSGGPTRKKNSWSYRVVSSEMQAGSSSTYVTCGCIHLSCLPACPLRIDVSTLAIAEAGEEEEEEGEWDRQRQVIHDEKGVGWGDPQRWSGYSKGLHRSRGQNAVKKIREQKRKKTKAEEEESSTIAWPLVYGLTAESSQRHARLSRSPITN